MKTILAILLLSISALAAFAQQVQSSSPPSQNWQSNRMANQSAPVFVANSGWAANPTTKEIAFGFTLPSGSCPIWRTSAGIYDAAGVNLIRTLWSNKSYNPGTYGFIWDGNNDAGTAVSTGVNYSPRVAYNCISYVWDGILFDTDLNPLGPNTWNGSTASFPTDIAFINGRGYAGTGYGENGAVPIANFDETNPNGPVYPLIRYSYGNGLSQFTQTDGNQICTLMQQTIASSAYRNGVYCFSTTGQPYTFSSGVALNATQWADQTQQGSPGQWAGLLTIDGSQFNGSATAGITGFAVQYGAGTIIATAHGRFQPEPSQAVVASLDQVWLFSKSTGAQTATVSVTNPQDMAFDLNGNLWVVSGSGTGDALYEITGVGSSNTVTNMTSTLSLSNPMWVKVSPTTGDVFVIDGGTHQQIFEYNPTTFALVSTIGLSNGYNHSGTCNANVDPTGPNTPTFLFDGAALQNSHFAGLQTGRPSSSWISIDDHGDVWIGDYPNWRILHMHWNGSAWVYVNRIISNGWQYYSATPRGAPTRVWAGFAGMVEGVLNYSIPLVPGDGSNGAWQYPVRNWIPCLIAANVVSGEIPQLQDVQVFPNGQTVGLVRSLVNGMYTVTFGTNGMVAFDTATLVNFRDYFAPDGSIYDYSATGSGPETFTITNRALTGYDGNNLPVWSSSTTNVATYTANHVNGQPYMNALYSTTWPSAGNILPMIDTAYNSDATGVAMHLGGVPVGGTALQWQTRKQRVTEMPDGEGSFPGINLNGVAQGGVMTWAMANSHDIFAFDSGNYQNWACQYFHYRDDGLLLGQFGWMGSVAYTPQAINTGIIGHSSNTSLANQPKAPGFCGDSSLLHAAQVGSDYYIFTPEENYYHGIHRLHISNLSTEHEAAASGALGSIITLTQTF